MIRDRAILGVACPLTDALYVVTLGAKVAEVDARGPTAQVHGLGDRLRRTARRVLEAIGNFER
jgi:hypothetical protein